MSATTAAKAIASDVVICALCRSAAASTLERRASSICESTLAMASLARTSSSADDNMSDSGSGIPHDSHLGYRRLKTWNPQPRHDHLAFESGIDPPPPVRL